MSLRLVNAEFLKLRKRRGLVISGLVLTVLPMLIAFTTLVVLHANNPAKNGPAGGMENFAGSMEVLTLLSAVAAILVGSTLGTGDLGAGVFRELVVTGRSRIALFAARVPAGLGLLLVIIGAAFAITAIASTVFAGSEGPQREQVAPGAWETTLGYLAPSATLLLKSAGWLALSTAVAMVLALGVASLVGSRGTSIGILLGWWIVAMPLLQAMGVLGSLRQGFVGTAIERVGPVPLVPPDPAVSMSVLAAVAVLGAWAVVPLAAGAWRTATRDA
jgi:ABC-type multidrug transport system permease subunit